MWNEGEKKENALIRKATDHVLRMEKKDKCPYRMENSFRVQADLFSEDLSFLPVTLFMF